MSFLYSRPTPLRCSDGDMNVRAVDGSGSGDVCRWQRWVIGGGSGMFGGYGGGGGEAYEQAATSLSDKTGDCPKKNRGLSAGKSFLQSARYVTDAFYPTIFMFMASIPKSERTSSEE